MLKLPRVTLICLTGINFDDHLVAVEKSCEGIEWGAVKIIYDKSISSIDLWNKAIVYDLWKYVDTEFAMLIHPDGYVINPELWKDEWLEYDYIGAPWPLPKDDFSYRGVDGDIVRVGNSVSLRSKRLLQAPTDYNFEWRFYYGNSNEDGFLCVHNRHVLEGLGMKFAPLEVAVHFSKEHEIEENKGLKTFAFHTIG